MIQEVRTGSS